MNDLPVSAHNLKWLREQMLMACDMSQSVETLRKQGYSDPAILDAFEAVRPRGNALAEGSRPPPLIRRMPKNLHRVDNRLICRADFQVRLMRSHVGRTFGPLFRAREAGL